MELKDRILTKVYRAASGQTFTEYSMIVLSVGLVAFSAYAGLGAGIKTFAETLITFIASAAESL